MGGTFGLQGGYETDHMKGSLWSEQCLWSETLIFDAALTKLLHWSSDAGWEGQGLPAQSVCQRPDSAA